MTKKKLAIFASGSGSNAENIISYFSTHENIKVEKVFSNNPHAGVHERAKRLGIPSVTFLKKDFLQPMFSDALAHVDYIILAGFLWMIPEHIIQAFPNRIINIHPSLLPKYGGKGMYGSHVHHAVIDSGEHESGITIHLVNEEYDKGRVLFQAKCEVVPTDTAMSLAEKIHDLEYAHFPKAIESYIVSGA